MTEADVAHLATALGLHGSPTRDAAGYEVRDGDAILTVDTGGGATYVSYSSSGNAGSGSSPGSTGSAGGSATNPAPGAPDAPSSPPAQVDPAPPVPAPDVTIEKPAPVVVPSPPVTVPAVPMPTIPPAVDVPNAADAQSIAKSLLADLGVLGDRQWSYAVTDADGVAVSCAPDGPCVPPPPASITARTVTASLQLDGHDVPGVSWSVTIGSHRKVEWLAGTWAVPDAGTNYPLRSTNQVFEDLQHGRAQYVGGQPMIASDVQEIAPAVPNAPTDTTNATGTTTTMPPLVVHVTGVALGTARWDGTDNGVPVAYLVPTYRFHATVDGGSPYDIELLALEPGSFTVAETPVTVVPDTGTPETGGPKTGIVSLPTPTAVPTVVAPLPDATR